MVRITTKRAKGKASGQGSDAAKKQPSVFARMFGKDEGKAEGARGQEGEQNVASWQTTRIDPGHQISYAAQMTLTFAAIATMTVLLLTVMLAIVWERQFNSYTRANMERLAASTAETLASEYEQNGGWTDEMLLEANSTVSLSSKDIGIQIIDSSGTVLFDDTWDEDETGSSIARAQGSKASSAPTDSGSAVTASVTTSDGKVVGMVRLWAFGSDVLLTSEDLTFRSNSYNAILIAAVAAIVIACIFGFIMARSLSRPIKRITSAASALRGGDLTARSGVRGEDEVGQLGETFDDMAATLERDMKLEHRLTSDVAHELRTPLMAMLATVEAMQDGVLPCDGEHLAVVAGEVQRLSRLVDAMLRLSRMENGTASFKPERCEMAELVRSIVASQQQLFSDNDLELTFHDDDLPETPAGSGIREVYANVDRDMMNQAVTNLMSNALRYTSAGGKVDVSVGKDKSDVLISVTDTGMGIAPEDLSRVFGRFWRSDASRERASGGLGVGLSLTKQIVDMHHGYISVESELGNGTTFTLHIPLGPHERVQLTRRRPSQ